MRRRTPPKQARPQNVLPLLGSLAAPPFVGRTAEIAQIIEALGRVHVVVLRGAVGSGKSRLAAEVATSQALLSYAPAVVRCFPGDRGAAVLGRVERALDALPGAAAEALANGRLLILDDIHHLPDDDVSALTAAVTADVDSSGRVIFVTRDALTLPRGVGRFDLDLEGLDDRSARELWAACEDSYGPTPAGDVDRALTRTRGMPLPLRREYARSAFGADAWERSALGTDDIRALEALAVLRVPAAPAALGAILDLQPEQALAALVSRQLIDPVDGGRFFVHDIVREETLASSDPETLRSLHISTAALIASVGRGRQGGARLAWDAGDDGAVGALDPVDRLREAVTHALAGGDADGACALLVELAPLVRRRGCAGEVLALLDTLDRVGGGNAATASLRAEIALARGAYADARERLADTTAAPAIQVALAAWRTADLEAARRLLTSELGHGDANARCEAAALLSEIELARGDVDAAETLASTAFERDRAALNDLTRARLHLAMANAADRAGRSADARAALSRAFAAARGNSELLARIDGVRAQLLGREGRIDEATAALERATLSARELDAAGLIAELAAADAVVASRKGSLGAATAQLRSLIANARDRGDEIFALELELELAAVALRSGQLTSAASTASSLAHSAKRLGLLGLSARAQVVTAAVDIAELRYDSAKATLDSAEASAPLSIAASDLAKVVRAELASASGHAKGTAVQFHGCYLDEIDTALIQARLSLAQGEFSIALEAARHACVGAERMGRTADLAESLAMRARMQLARGDREAAAAAATRAAREAATSAHRKAHVGALLCLSAIAREDGDIAAAAAYARDANELATSAGLVVERLVAVRALDVISGTPSDPRPSAAANMTSEAVDAAARYVADLGLTALRPYRTTDASGTHSLVADANADLLRLGERSLAVDGIREEILRNGKSLADLRRRSLLKRLLFLFAASPEKVFSKEDIVGAVWEVEYHPLRHDAALFTNIMRIRRLLGADGAELIRVSEEGYWFAPPKDYLFVERRVDQRV